MAARLTILVGLASLCVVVKASVLLLQETMMTLWLLALILLRTPKHNVHAFGVVVSLRGVTTTTTTQLFSDWSDFQYVDDDDDLLDGVDDMEYAKEEDSQEHKAEIGSTLAPPTIEMDAEPILVPQGSVLDLNMDNVLGVLAGCREEIGTLFGYSAENRGVGITGGVDFVDLDGPVVVLRLKGRFWHERTTVLSRVKAYLMGRIPEIMDVEIEDPYQLTDEANES